MAASKKLKTFKVVQAGESFSVHVEDESGHVLELIATRDQIDLIDDALAELLQEDESADEVK